MKKTIAILLALCMLACLLAGCQPGGNEPKGSGNPSESTGSKQTQSGQNTTPPAGGTTAEPIKVGGAVAKTGSTPDDGIYAERGMQLAIDEINAAGGINGRPLELIVEDTQGTTEGTVNAANKLISENVAFMLGFHSSPQVTAVADIIEQTGIPYITSASGVSLKEGVESGTWNSLYFCKPLDTMQASIAANAIMELYSPKKVGILYVSDSFGTGAKEVAEATFAAANVEVQSESFNPDDKDMTGQILNIQNGGCDAVLVWAHNNEMVVLARQTYELGFDIPILSSGATVLPQVQKLLEPEWVDGWNVVTNYLSTAEYDYVQNYVKAFTAAYGGESPDVISASFYGAAYIMAEAMKACEDPTDSAQLNEAMKSVSIQGVISYLEYTDSHEFASEAFICEMDGLTAKVVKAVKG